MKYNQIKNRDLKISIGFILLLFFSCQNTDTKEGLNNTPLTKELIAKDILGNPNHQAISFGGYRQKSRDQQPTVEQLKQDMKLISAIGIKILRTYQTKLAHASNVIKAISELKKEDPSFEMYVMLGAWIDCENAWTNKPNHDEENESANAAEIARAVELAIAYPDIVKIIAVGNEAMVKWATSYYVQPKVILKWVNHLQKLKKDGKLQKELWVTSSDNFASWGGGENIYHTEDLTALIKAVDYVSLHTYPMHDTHYNPDFWGVAENEDQLSETEKIYKVMERSAAYAKGQYESTAKYIKSLGVEKSIHIGESGWASSSNGFYGSEGSNATDEFKQGLYHKMMRTWTKEKGISCFYFEAFDEPWKDAQNSGGSENHFGLFTVDGQVKYALWHLVDQGVFNGLRRGNNAISKTHNGDPSTLMGSVKLPKTKTTLTTW